MDRLLVLVIICGLGGVYAGVVHRNTPMQVDGLQSLAAFASQLIPRLVSQNQPKQITESESQTNADPANGSIIESIFRSFFSNNGKIMNYELSEVMQMLNHSLELPVGPRTDTSRMTRDQFLEHVQDETNIFNNIFNSMSTTLFEPNRVVKFLNLTIRAYDPTITNNPNEQLALQMEHGAQMLDFQNKFHEVLKEDKVVTSTANPVGSSTLSPPGLQQMTSTEMYNTESIATIKPDNAGALSGSEGMNATPNLETAMMNFFQSISQASGSSNQPMQGDYTYY